METSAMIGIIAAFIVYFIVMLAVGFFFMNKNKTTKEYVLGGRKLHYFVSAMSAEASDMSGWLLLGLPGVAYLTGLSSAGWTAIGLAIGTYLNWKLIAKRLRVYTHKAKDSITIPEFFKNRFGDKKAFTSVISSIFIIIFFAVYTASQFAAGGKLFHSIFGIDYTVAMLIGAAIVVIYTFVGGFKAVCLTDTIQACLMFFALILVPIIALVLLSGDGVSLASLDPHMFSLFHEFNATSGVFEFISVFTIVSGLAWAFGYFGQPHILPRFMGIENPDEIPRARRIAMIWVIISMAAAIFIGLVGQVFFSTPLFDSETVFIDMSGGVLASLPFLAGIIYCGILGAIMSTASSQMLAASSSLSQDLYKTLFRKKASDKELLLISKLAVLLIAAIAFTLALDPNSSVFGIVSFAWAGFGASFGSVILVGLFWKRMNWQGALAGVLGGGITAAVWYFVVEKMLGNPLYEMVPGVIVSLICIFIVTKITSPPPREVTDTFDEYVKEIGDQRT
ncbi:MAG TPA: sodium/proline symporter PutP [Methanocorpusculum sp.]|nr:sodium/proline symporter PutP [Methanocorpusculum sp.]HJJ39768.1 sodium/proline symporter PutP [Methanocorpusculum sp.]HJJ49377.1 sodium/proline symporter PutP [Methanocorpusculum sp.]HJJ56579.1 sodium/proline symporter PutP [Methanocorpusculum sp.]